MTCRVEPRYSRLHIHLEWVNSMRILRIVVVLSLVSLAACSGGAGDPDASVGDTGGLDDQTTGETLLPDQQSPDGNTPDVELASCGSTSLNVGTVSQVVEPQGGTLTSDGVVFVIPAGALTEAKTITLRQLADTVCPPGVYRVGPTIEVSAGEEHTLFKKLSSLTLPYEEGRIPSGRSESEIVVFFAHSEAGPWRPLPSKLDATGNLIGIEVPHLTLYMPGIPVETPGVFLPIPTRVYLDFDVPNLSSSIQTPGLTLSESGQPVATFELSLQSEVLISGLSGSMKKVLARDDVVPGDLGTLQRVFEVVTNDDGLFAQVQLAEETAPSGVVAPPVVLFPAPGPAPGTSASFTKSMFNPRITPDGLRAFNTFLDDGVGAIYAGSDGNLTLVTADGAAVPGVDGVTLKRPFDALVLNAKGHVAFTARLEGSGVTSGDNAAIFFWDGDALQLVARKGATLDGKTFTMPSPQAGLQINAADRVAFVDDNGIWLWDAINGAKLVVAVGSLVDAATITAISPLQQPSLNDAGQVAFRATLDDSTDAVLLLESDASVTLVAKTGDSVAGHPDGATLKTLLRDPELNQLGQVVFSGTVPFGDPLTPTRQATFVTDLSGTPRLLFQAGAMLWIGPDELRLIHEIANPLRLLGRTSGGASIITNQGEVGVVIRFDGPGGPLAIVLSRAPQ
ncbi:MAG: hypothetical protein KC609_05040 [Myxococcales bacterium]|nr:hypothetical protein [Myxococcales bacterium]